MVEYIEREAALKFQNELEPLLCRNVVTHDIMSATKDADLVEYLRSIPAADVAPVRHGRWIKARGSWCTPGGDPVWECSECGKGVHVYGIEHGTYGADVADGQWVACPNCGARMDGGEP